MKKLSMVFKDNVANPLISDMRIGNNKEVFYLFDLILYAPSTIFPLNRDGSSWVEPVQS